MLAAVIPAKNEEGRISRLLGNLLTLREIRELAEIKVNILYFPEALGIDVPRAVGAAYAKKRGHKRFLFVDGDLTGDIREGLKELILNAEKNHLDMALTDCYPIPPQGNTLAREMLAFRQRLNEETRLFTAISWSTPSHGPHLVSRRFLDMVPLRELAVPPAAMVHALKARLSIGVAARIPHHFLGSSIKDLKHTQMVSETIIGDTLEALELYRGEKRTRTHQGRVFLGYHPFRRLDLLESYLVSTGYMTD